MLSGQRIPYTFHPYNQLNSHSTRSRPHFRIDHTHTPSGCVNQKENDTQPDNAGSRIERLSNLPMLAQRSEVQDSTSILPTQQPQLQPFHSSSLPGPSFISNPRAALDYSTAIENRSVVNESKTSSNHFSNSAIVAGGSRRNGRILSLPQLTKPSHKSRGYSSTQSHVQSIIHYLQTWNPPAEYYARRRHQHPSLLYPSRRPNLPSLLEEHVSIDGNLVLTCPQLAMSTSLRAYRRKIFPVHGSCAGLTRGHTALEGWDDESDEDIESDFSDDDDSVGSDGDCDEAVTPVNSPPSNASYFLQPLILTKPPGY